MFCLVGQDCREFGGAQKDTELRKKNVRLRMMAEIKLPGSDICALKKSKLCLFLCGRLSGIVVPYCPPVFTTHDHIVLFCFFHSLLSSDCRSIFCFFISVRRITKLPRKNSLNTDSLSDSFSDTKLRGMAFVFPHKRNMCHYVKRVIVCPRLRRNVGRPPFA